MTLDNNKSALRATSDALIDISTSGVNGVALDSVAEDFFI